MCVRRLEGVDVVGLTVVCSSLGVVGVFGGVGIGSAAGAAHRSSVGVGAVGVCWSEEG